MGNRHNTWFRKWNDKNLYFQEWMTDSPKALVGIVHGQSDHSGRFIHVAESLNAAGYGVAAIDLIGHGRSEGKRGHVDRFDDYISQLDILVEHLAVSGLPVFLYGQSMGGLVTLSYKQKNPGRIKGVIASSPWLRLAFDPPAWRQALGRVMLRIAPSMIQPAELDVTFLAHPEDVQTAYVKDPLVHSKISPAAYFGIVDAGNIIMSEKLEPTVPVLIMHGTGDKITDHTLSARLAGENGSLIVHKEFSGLYHELHNELEKEEVFSTVLQWLDQQTQSL